MDADASNRVGRPSKGDFSDPNTGEINETGLKLIQTAAGFGLPKKEIAALLGMSGRTFYDRCEKFPELLEIIAEGEAAAGFKVANALMGRAVAGDMAAIRWYEMTRKNRAEKSEAKVEETQYVVEVPAKQSEEAWAEQHSPSTGTPPDDGGSPSV